MTKGKIGFHGGNVAVQRPRVRGYDGHEVELPSWTAAQAEDWLGRWAMNLMLINVSTRKLRRAARLPEGDLPAIAGDGTSKSAASRRFVALSAERLAEWMTSDLSKLDLLVIQIDGLHIGDDLVLVAALGIDGDGNKHPLGLIEGATENAAVVQALVDNLIERGLDPKVGRLFIIDGAKALSKVIDHAKAGGGRYGKHFRDVITLLVDLHMIKIVTKGHNVREWRRREITTICPTGKLLRAFPPITTITHNAFTRIDPPEVIILKDGDGELLNYSDDKNTRRWRNEMRTINFCLREASISVVSPDKLLDENGFTIRPDLRTLRRLWNNSDWTQGGRLYDGFWQTMKRERPAFAHRPEWRASGRPPCFSHRTECGGRIDGGGSLCASADEPIEIALLLTLVTQSGKRNGLRTLN